MTHPEQASSRREAIEAIATRPRSQALIIGGGINGLSTFRDLALQGIDVVLVERDDFASGASSASSHMMHGGVRYLENGEFRLVRESVHERNDLLKTAPHYVQPLPTTIPIFSTASGILAAPLRLFTHRQGRPQERGAILIKLGLSIYDSFSRDGGAVPRHRFARRRASLRSLPQLNPATKYTATYYDGSLVNPERLALDVLQDGLAAGPHARAANYLEAIGAVEDRVLLRDRLTGEEFAVCADVVVNASGPWTDLTNAALGLDTRLMGGTKGSHIVLDNAELLAACGGRELFFENDDGRIVLIYPLMDRILVGTTDLEADPREPAVCTEEEIDYFFALVAHVFPRIRVDRSQIVYRFAGIRPLPHHQDTQPGFVSRDYRIVADALPGLPNTRALSLVGGKWTTFRALGARLSDEVLAALGATRRVSTAGLAIGGGRGFPVTGPDRAEWIARFGAGVSSERARVLLGRYGTIASGLIAYLAEHGDTPLESLGEYSVAEIEYLVTREHVAHLSDVLLRRTSMAFRGVLSRALVSEVGDILARVLDWSPVRLASELALVFRELEEAHGVSLENRPSVPVH